MFDSSMPAHRLNGRNCGIAVVLLILATVIAGLLLPTEPKYQGKSLSHWMDQLPSIDIGIDGPQ